MFLQIHTLTDYSAALQNRDQSGLAKRAPYGDATRQRISSQCYKAALRDAGVPFVRFDAATGDLVDDRMADLAADLGTGMAVRSRLIFPRRVMPAVRAALEGTGISGDDHVQAAADLFSKKKDEGDEAEEGEAGTGDEEVVAGPVGALKQPIVLGSREIEALVSVLVALARDGVPSQRVGEALGFPQKQAAAKPAKGKKADAKPAKAAPLKLGADAKDAVENFKLVRAQPGLDAQLFGRFSTADLFQSVDGAVSVAHLLTVHPVMATPDYFTVLDMEQTDGEHGAAHANTTEIASGLFSGYVVLDVRTLARNLPTASASDLGAIAGWLVRAVYQVEPAAKRGSTAPFGATHEMLVELGRRQPRSLIGAFQRALRPEILRDQSLSEAAADRLRNEALSSNARGGKPELQRFLSDDARGNQTEMAAYEILADAVALAVAHAAAGNLDKWRAA